MPVPTTEEAEIYKSAYKLFDIRAYIRLDHPLYESPFEDHFLGAALDENKWYRFLPSWGTLTVAGSTILLGTSIPAISPAWVCSKEAIAFPNVQKDYWVHEWRMRFPTITGYGVFYRVCSLDSPEAIVAVKCNLADGLTLEFQDGTRVWQPGADSTWNRFRFEYLPDTDQYRLTADADDDGIFELGPWTISATNLKPDYIVIGNSTARQPWLGTWTEIEVDYVRTTGVSELYDIPVWAGPQYMYSDLGYADEVWAELPTVLRGNIDVHKRNICDILQLDLVNFNFGYDPAAPDFQLYTNFGFLNKPVLVRSRVSDGFSWTPWRNIYRGVFDEREIEERENGDTVLTVSARDIVRRRLARQHTIRAYSDYGLPITGLYMNMTAQQMILDLIQNVAGLPSSAAYVQETPSNTPRNFNITGESLADAIMKLMDDLGFCWWIRLSDGQLQIQDWYWGTGVPDYQMHTGEELTLVRWSEGATDLKSIVELTVENANIAGASSFSTNYPHAPFPFYGPKEYVTAVVAQDAGDLAARQLQWHRWRRLNRDIGGIRVRASCQDWVEHDLQIAVKDDKYLGISPEKHGVYIIDGWRHEWEGTSKFDTELILAPERPQNIIRALAPGILA